MPYTEYPISNKLPKDDDNALIISPKKQLSEKTHFHLVDSVLNTPDFTTIKTGAGMSINQSASNLNIVGGTTINSETIIRSTYTVNNHFSLKVRTFLSQRIINTQFFVELVDVIGDALTTTINSATSITVTIPSNTFTSKNIGQSMYIGNYTGTGTFVPQRGTIASVSGDNVTFTVASMAVGTGTCSLFGWNTYRVLYDGTTATNTKFDAFAYGWGSGDTTLTISTTANPGHMINLTSTDHMATISDSLVASSATYSYTTRGSRNISIPDSDVELYIQFRVVNGTTAPASSTTYSVSTIICENSTPMPVDIQGIQHKGNQESLPVRTDATSTLNSVTTVSTVTAVTSITNPVLSPIPALVADVASAALTTTTTTGTITPTNGRSYHVNIPVTAVTGTTPTLDVVIQESDDTATNWFDVYHFPRISATGIYRSPKLPYSGNRIRYVQTVGGTTPSFTRAINRLQSTDDVLPYRQSFIRTFTIDILNARTTSLFCAGCKNAQLIVNIGASTAESTLTLEGSDDNTTWYPLSTTLTPIANSTVQISVTNIAPTFISARVSTAGTSTTFGYIILKGY
jgi:hypothetical protein